MSQWVSNYANLRDLSVAQGHAVPRIDEVVAGHENPTALHVAEDTGDLFFRHYMGASGDSRAPPDLCIIQQMLEMVRVDNPPPQHMPTASVLNPNGVELLPQHRNLNDNKQYTDRWGRNVALKSLLEADNQKSRTQKLRLLTPDDIVQSNMAFAREQSQRYFLLQPNGMFKRKNPQKVSVPELNNNTYQMDMYEPSKFAIEYYNKHMDRVEPKTYLKDDIWVKAEKKIEEIEKRKEQAARSSQWGFIDDNHNLNLVRLPHHRHVIAEECVVCDMVKKHSFNIDEILSEDKRM